jgi:hypothetical protein
MTSTLRTILGGAILAALAAGCGTSPPGAGFTSGEKPTFTAEEKPAVRDDLHEGQANPGDAALAESAASSPGEAGKNTGTGSRNMAPVDKGTSTSAPAGGPPKIDSSGENETQGGTKSPGNINTGTPRSPQ